MTMLLLKGNEIFPAIQKLMASDGDAIAAVAFWGKNGAKNTGIADRKQGARVICDLFSGACNPTEIRGLQSTARIKVKTLDGMHAKVWNVGDSTIIGSANASANGLGFEGRELSGNVEAAVLVESATFGDDVRSWFDDLWNQFKCKEISPADIDNVVALWKKRQGQKCRLTTDTMFDALRSGKTPKSFGQVRIVAYMGDDISKQAKAAFNSNGRQHYSDEELNPFNVWPLYEDLTDWQLKPDDIILDFFVRKPRTTPSMDGIWRIKKNPFIKVPDKRNAKHRIILCEPLVAVEGLRLPKPQGRMLARAIRMRLDRCGWTEDENSCLIDMPLLDFWHEERANLE